MATRILFLLWIALTAIPAFAQFRMMEITFQGIGCASCIESMPERLQRLRGVESAVVDAGKGSLTVKLASRNRVRLEQVRDLIEQDGTKTAAAKVQVAGAVSETDGKWMLDPPGVGTQYDLENGRVTLAPGSRMIWGDAPSLHPGQGRIVIRVSRVGEPE